MVIVEDSIVSLELFKEEFVCNLLACKGACCVEGDAGAPLDEEEKAILEDIREVVEPYLPEAGRQALEQQGAWIENGNYIETPLVDGQECAYTVFKNGIAMCGIEQAHRDGKTDFQKPVSCHLYPVRISKLTGSNLTALNYDRWDICSPACSHGTELGVPVFRFLKAPLIRRFGESFYDELEKVFIGLRQQDMLGDDGPT